MDYWKFFRTQKYLKHKNLLNKSITVCFGDPKYFSFEGYSCKSPLLVQFLTISVRWRSCSNWPTECSMPRRGKSKYFQDITGHYILLSCPRIQIYCRQQQVQVKTFSVKLKPLASNKCTLVPASMKRIHPPLTNAKWVSAAPLPLP